MMKRFMYPVMLFMGLALFLMPASLAFAQVKKVPITYQGDTEKTIARRAKWVEGAAKEGKLVWWGTLSPKEKAQIIVEFNKIYPFITVEHWRGNSIEMVAKLDGEHAGGLHSMDIGIGSDPINLPRWRKMGRLEPFVDVIPGLNRINKKMYSVHGDWLIPGNSVVTPQYKTKLVTAAEAPKSWEDLLLPKWKGQMGVPSVSLKNWAGMAMSEGGWGIEKTENYLKKLKEQEPRWGAGYSATHALLIAGEFKIQASGYLYHAFLSQKKGAPVAWNRVDPVLLAGSSFILVKNAPHPNASRLFFEWLFSPQGMAVWEKVTLKGAAYPGAGTQQSKALEGLNLIYETEEVDIKIAELGLVEKFAKILGVTPTEE